MDTAENKIDPKIKEYFSKHPKERQEIMYELREILLEVFPDCNEYMAWGVATYDNLYYIANLKKQVNMGFSIIGLSPEELKRFEGGGKTMRHLKFPNLNSIEKKELIEIIKMVKKKAKPVKK